MKEYLIGFAIGIAVALFVLIFQLMKRRSVVKEKNLEIKNLKDMINQRMDLESEGLSKLKNENEELKKKNENLRVTNANLMQKPGRAETRQLQIYQKAVDRLTINSPGFGAAWQSAIKESESEFEEIYNGTQSFWKRILPSRSDAKLISDKDIVDEQ